MKTTYLLALAVISLSLASAFGQPQPAPVRPAPGQPRVTAPVEEPKLTNFNLDFPGGTPQELVNAIQKATGKPLNAIIPDEHAQMRLPPLRMSNVNVMQLFQALETASFYSETYVTSSYSPYAGAPPTQQYANFRGGYGFKTQGPATDDSIWYFFAEKLRRPPPVSSCRFYALSPYLERGLTVDDITTAIQTGWKMLGDTDTPTINYHKDTKLLIAVGEPSKLTTIDDVLKALTPPTPPAEKKSEPKPAEKKAEK